MCNNPTTRDNVTFACKVCNDCVNTSISTWVYRAMAEKHTSKYCYLLALTYGSDTQEKRDGAAVFRYSDIQLFMKRLKNNYRSQLAAALGVQLRDLKENAKIRYIVAGELGSKKGRVHWHVVIYSDVDLLSIGDWSSFVTKKTVTKKEQKITTDPNREKRLLWSCWPMGLLVVQIPDQGGMAYALKYALKDQFNVVKSHGTMREAKADTFGSGFFRMSKTPPIGANWLAEKLARLAAINSVLPSIKLYIPDTYGFLYPSGYLRNMLLDGLRAINEKSNELYGSDTSQWSSLLASVVDQPKLWERLKNEQEEEQEDEDFVRDIKLRTKENLARQSASDTRSRCGHAKPCASCTRGFSTEYYEKTVLPAFRAGCKAHGSPLALEKHYRKNRICNPFCVLKELPSTKRAFNKNA